MLYKKDTKFSSIGAKRFVANLALLMAAVVFSLLLFEIYLRVFHPQHALGGQVYFDNKIGVFRFLPSREFRIKYPEFEYILKTNSKCLRDYEYPYEKSKDTLRILVLGDSFTFGHGVEFKDAFVKQLEAAFKNKIPSKSIEVINMGMIEYGTSDCYKMLVSEGRKYKPDLVIYAFFLNDLNDAFRKLYKPQKIDSPHSRRNISSGSGTGVSRGKKNIFEKTYTYHFLLSSFKKISTVRNFLYLSGLSKHNGPLYYLQPYIKHAYTPDTKRTFGICFDYIDRMASYCKDINSEFSLIYIPDYFQSYYQTYPDNDKYIYEAQYDIDKPQTLLKKFCAGRRIGYIDSTPFLRQEALAKRLYYDSDQHFTKDGHAVIAKILFNEILKRNPFNAR